MNETILVTGGAGFIGSHVCDRLLNMGKRVICIDNLNPYYSPKRKIKNIQHNFGHKNFSFIVLDIQKKDQLEQVFQKNKIDKIIHLAARAGVRPSIEKPLSVPQSAIIAATKLGMDVVQVQPKGFELDPEVIKACEGMAKMNGSKFEVSYDMDEAFKDAHVVYPKCWGSKDYFAKDEKGPDLEGMQKLFDKNKHWKCDEEKMKLADPNCIYMHCLPADRG